jgi:calcineurin-like phosphoesterase family protein
MSAFVTADLHLDHAKILSFIAPDGSPSRPYSCLEEMQQDLEERWNKTVNQRDTVYVLGDVAFSKTGVRLMERFNGRKVLVAGNHDRNNAKLYLQYFDDVRGAYFITATPQCAAALSSLTCQCIHRACLVIT